MNRATRSFAQLLHLFSPDFRQQFAEEMTVNIVSGSDVEDGRAGSGRAGVATSPAYLRHAC